MQSVYVASGYYLKGGRQAHCMFYIQHSVEACYFSLSHTHTHTHKQLLQNQQRTVKAVCVIVYRSKKKKINWRIWGEAWNALRKKSVTANSRETERQLWTTLYVLSVAKAKQSKLLQETVMDMVLVGGIKDQHL